MKRKRCLQLIADGWNQRIPAEGPHMRGWLAKLAGSVLRIAGQFHIVQHGSPHLELISVETMQSAITIGGYFHEHARIMFRMMDGREGQSEAAAILEILRRHNTEIISRRDLWRKVRGRVSYTDPSVLAPALDTLTDLGWIRILKTRDGTRGRYSEVISLNPAIHGQKGQNPVEDPENSNSVPFVHVFDVYAASDNHRGNVQPLRPDPSEPLASTGTDGAFPGEFKL